MTTRPRGRPRSFDTDRALDRAVDVFWTHGFAASSLDQLSDAMGIARPSLYAAFGGKEDLFLASMQRFVAEMAAIYRDTVFGSASYRAGLLAYLRAAIRRYTAGGVARGCLAVCTATSAAATEPRVREALAEILRGLDEALAGTLRRARDAGELPPGADLEALAAILSATQQSLAIRARAGASDDELDRIARGAIAAVFSGSTGRTRARPPARARPRR